MRGGTDFDGAPGTDFDGVGGHDWVCLSFASSPEVVAEAVDRVTVWQQRL